PIHRLPLGTDIETTVDDLVQLLPQNDFASSCIELIRGVWRPGVTLSDGVRATLEVLLGPFGMAFVDAGDPALKAASVGVLEAAARGAETHEAALTRRVADLSEEGWSAQ